MVVLADHPFLRGDSVGGEDALEGVGRGSRLLWAQAFRPGRTWQAWRPAVTVFGLSGNIRSAVVQEVHRQLADRLALVAQLEPARLFERPDDRGLHALAAAQGLQFRPP